MIRTKSMVVRAMASRLISRVANRPMSGPTFQYQDVFETEKHDSTNYRKLTSDYVSVVDGPFGKKYLKVEPEGLTLLAKQAMIDIAHLLRPAHLEQVAKILKDPEASANDKFVALELLKNANVAAGMILPSCQDTGTGICMAKRGQYVITDGEDEAAISKGIFDAYTTTNLRYSQVSPLDMFKEVNTKCNLPAQIDLYAIKGDAYKFLFMAKGGGSANKTYLYQQTKALLNPSSLMSFVEEKVAIKPCSYTRIRLHSEPESSPCLSPRLRSLSVSLCLSLSLSVSLSLCLSLSVSVSVSLCPSLSLSVSLSLSLSLSLSVSLSPSLSPSLSLYIYIYIYIYICFICLCLCPSPFSVPTQVKSLGTAACPPYHIALAVGGLR
jgi:tartrate dehydratase alpha subunit/fumarate hydratase class I-like protein